MSSNRINVILGADDRASKVVTGLRGQFEMFKRDAMAGFGLGAGISIFNLATRALGGVSDMVGSAISAASDLQESQAKVGEVFTESAGDIMDWSKDSATAMGLSQQAALEAAGTFGNFIQALGNTEEEANGMSKTLVELAADLASFNNTEIEEVILALRSGLAGEAEPMRRLGISISAARVQANILTKGIAGTAAEITDAMKVAERYAIILEDTTKAQGDFARTSDGLANKQRILAAQMDNALAALGAALLPIAEGFVGLAADIIPEAVRQVEALAGAVTGLADDLNALITQEIRASTEAELVAEAYGVQTDALLKEANALRQADRLTERLARRNQALKDTFQVEYIDEADRQYMEYAESVEEAADATGQLTDVEELLHRAAVALNQRLAVSAPLMFAFGRGAEDAADPLWTLDDAVETATKSLGKNTHATRLWREQIAASEAAAERLGEAVDYVAGTSFRDLRDEAKEAGKAIQQALGQDANKTIKQLRAEEGKLSRMRNRAMRENNWRALALIDTRREEVDEALAAHRTTKRTYLDEIKTHKNRKKAVEDVADEVGALGRMDVKPTINVDTASAMSKLAELQARLNAIYHMSGTVTIGATIGFQGPGFVQTPKRARGGPVSPGQSYLVGERGPEVLQMGNQGGYVHANGSGGGGHSHVIVMDGRVVGELVDARLGRRSSTLGRDGSYRSSS